MGVSSNTLPHSIQFVMGVILLPSVWIVAEIQCPLSITTGFFLLDQVCKTPLLITANYVSDLQALFHQTE